ncbi:MAG: NAD(P)-dependent oxidoreductase [Candidatus Latescibacterota bacterium]|nr:NAD(P)-dependent oxidoreductase [Candidatus Latescibacterota bacterium]
MSRHVRSVAVTGALGNLGNKLLQHLAANSQVKHLIALDRKPPEEMHRSSMLDCVGERDVEIEWVECDLSDWEDLRWRDAFDRSEVVVHFAAQNPYPDASWSDADTSLIININTAHAAEESPLTNRYVFATSNHVMGQYKDEKMSPGSLSPDLDPAVGTVWNSGTKDIDSTRYASAKWAGERLCDFLGKRSANSTSFVSIRIGWCQPGANETSTLSATGTPTLKQNHAENNNTDRWFKQMWLSNRDFCHLFQQAIEAENHTWPNNAIIVNGMSDNADMPWDLKPTRKYLNYNPMDDVFSEEKNR